MFSFLGEILALFELTGKISTDVCETKISPQLPCLPKSALGHEVLYRWKAVSAQGAQLFRRFFKSMESTAVITTSKLTTAKASSPGDGMENGILAA